MSDDMHYYCCHSQFPPESVDKLYDCTFTYMYIIARASDKQEYLHSVAFSHGSMGKWLHEDKYRTDTDKQTLTIKRKRLWAYMYIKITPCSLETRQDRKKVCYQFTNTQTTTSTHLITTNTFVIANLVMVTNCSYS